VLLLADNTDVLPVEVPETAMLDARELFIEEDDFAEGIDHLVELLDSSQSCQMQERPNVKDLRRH
jgi:hypothetical protein